MAMINCIIGKILKSFRYSCAGIIACWQKEISFRIEVVCLITLSAIVPFIADLCFKRCMLWASLLLILVIELLNSSIEKVADSLVKELQHPLIKYAKDAASAAVMLSIIIAILIWIGVLTS